MVLEAAKMGVDLVGILLAGNICWEDFDLSKNLLQHYPCVDYCNLIANSHRIQLV